MTVFFFFRAAELSAGGVDIRSQRTADGSADAMLFQYLGKGQYRAMRCLGKSCFFYGIDGDQIDMNGHGITFRAQLGVEQRSETHSRGGRIIFTGDQRIFKGNTAACRAEIISSGIEQAIDGIFVVNGHDL